ncbi:hypothetical protein [Ancylobacter sp. IITR112]|uniref:hypothetical protein n=1 Tax=Ancylobacter sp. IITR112 TaxID=3138073 RepID=UPI00352A741E
MKLRTAAFAALAVGAALLASPFARAQTTSRPADPAAEPQTAPQAAPPPLVLLLDGLGVYVENDYIGVSSLARPLARQGFRTRTDSHLMLKSKGLVPDVIIGHSMGGESALRYAAELARAGYTPPLVITIDAAPAPPACTVPRCINIAGPGFARVRGARNISAWDQGARFVNHAQLPTHPAVQQLILDETAAWMATWRASQPQIARSATPKPASRQARPEPAPRPDAAPAPAPSPAGPKMWTMPGWTLPDGSAPGWPGLRQGG